MLLTFMGTTKNSAARLIEQLIDAKLRYASDEQYEGHMPRTAFYEMLGRDRDAIEEIQKKLDKVLK